MVTDSYSVDGCIPPEQQAGSCLQGDGLASFVLGTFPSYSTFHSKGRRTASLRLQASHRHYGKCTTGFSLYLIHRNGGNLFHAAITRHLANAVRAEDGKILLTNARLLFRLLVKSRERRLLGGARMAAMLINIKTSPREVTLTVQLYAAGKCLERWKTVQTDYVKLARKSSLLYTRTTILTGSTLRRSVSSVEF